MTERVKSRKARRDAHDGSAALTLAQAVLQVAEQFGEDGQGTNGLRGYLVHLITTQPRVFARLLVQVVILELKNPTPEPPAKRVFETPEEIAAEFRRRGLPLPSTFERTQPVADLTRRHQRRTASRIPIRRRAS